MSKRKRAFKAEYARRIDRGVNQGHFPEPGPRPSKAERSRGLIKAPPEAD